MLPEIPACELTRVLEDCAAELLEAAGVERPPVDAFEVAAAQGILVGRSGDQRGRAQFVRLRGQGGRAQPSIFLRDEDRRERLQWALAHEVAESVAYRVFAELGVQAVEAPPDARERIANDLARRLLLPGGWYFPAARDCQWDLFALKARFPTASHELIARRMLDDEPPIIVTIFDHGRAGFRRMNRPGIPPPLTPLESSAWRQAHGSGNPVLEEDDGHEARAWPIHEPNWRREIVRLELPAGFEDVA